MRYYFHLNQRDAADQLVKRQHYSHRLPAGVQLCCTWHMPGGLFGDTGEVIAALYFSSPPTRWSVPVWELSRLVRVEGNNLPPLTQFISAAVQWIRRSKRIDLLISFADQIQGHHGGIYQAASWSYAGRRDKSMDGVIYGGSFIPGRTANSVWGTRSPRILANRGIIVTPHYDDGKHLYWKALNRTGVDLAAKVGLQCLAYPKPDVENVRSGFPGVSAHLDGRPV